MRHFDKPLDHVTRIEVSDCLYELLQRFVILLLFIEVVSMLLADLSNYFRREV